MSWGSMYEEHGTVGGGGATMSMSYSSESEKMSSKKEMWAEEVVKAMWAGEMTQMELMLKLVLFHRGGATGA